MSSLDALLQKQSEFSINKQFFVSPPPAGRRITAGFSYLQRIGKSASVDVWFPHELRQSIDALLSSGQTPGPDKFPAEWAAIRQFELLQEAGNYKIYDLDATHLSRTLQDVTRNMRGGGYRVTVATIGSYTESNHRDELEILDRRLQNRISRCIHMLYLEEQSAKINETMARSLRKRSWNYQEALPHVGATLGARDLFRPSPFGSACIKNETASIPFVGPHEIKSLYAADWVEDQGVRYVTEGTRLKRVIAHPRSTQYCVSHGVYQFCALDVGREIALSYRASQGERGAPSDADRRHHAARYFFDILDMLPQKHVVHDTAVGLQLPEAISENEWIYIAPDGEKVGDFMRLMDDLFAPFNGMSLSKLDGRADATSEIKSTAGSLRGYGDRLNAESDQFYRQLAQYAAG